MFATISAGGASAWGGADQIFDRLAGAWTLQRSISLGAEMSGRAVFRPLPDGLLAYREDGQVRMPDGKVFDGFREYLFEPLPGGFTVHFAEQPRREFHRILVEDQGGVLAGTASHLCVADTYDSHYSFRADGSFSIRHRVAGPRKDYVSLSTYTRIA